MESLIDDRAILDDENDDESFDEETGEARRTTNGKRNQFEDSSEEEDDDDDEEAQKEVAEGFIVDEDEDDDEARRERRRERKKRRREEREDEGLDEEDLELIGLKPAQEETEPKFKRLKRGPREGREDRSAHGINDIFRDSDEEDDAAESRRRDRFDRRGGQDEFDDFIEEDVFSDEEQQQEREDAEVARPRRRGIPDLGLADAAGLDEQAMEEFREAFGDGNDYNFALEYEDEVDREEVERDKHLELKDVFEPSQLAEKMLTDDDNEIRNTDEPERHQIARKPYRNLELTEDEVKAEAKWISDFMLGLRRLPSNLHEPFRRSIAQVLDFMIRDNYEVPFIFQHRRDYLMHVVSARDNVVEKLLQQDELWEIFEYDLKYRALVERKQTLQKTYDDLKSTNIAPDNVFEELLPQSQTIDELQDLQDYLYFQYASQMKDLALTTNGETNGTGMSRKKMATQSLFEEIRAGQVYRLVRAFGITADEFARNVVGEGVRSYTDDPSESPQDLADSLIDEEFSTGERALKAAKAMFVEELVMNPRFRKYLRQTIYTTCVVDCHRTEKGLRKIDEQHPYYEFKYLRNQEIMAFVNRPDLYLKMMKAEEEGLVEIKLRMPNQDYLNRQLHKHILTDNSSNVADVWNAQRREMVSTALDKLLAIMGRYVKENLRDQCQAKIASECRAEFFRRLDQSPFKPRGMKKGTIPRVLALSSGGGSPGREPIFWAYVSDDGRITESGRFTDLGPGDQERGLPDGKDVATFVDVVKRRGPEVIGVAGWTPDTRKLHMNIEAIVKNHNLKGPTFNDDDDDQDKIEPLDVIIVNDEVARLYHTSDRAKAEHPSLAPLTLYCVAIARYMQNPLQEYAALGRDVTSLSFHPAQSLLPQEKLMKSLETALIDIVNMVGVDPEDAAHDPKVATLLAYVCGLGPRKANHMIKTINMNGNRVSSREALLGIGVSHPALTLKVWSNAASFLRVPWDQTDEDAEFLDSTRIHPEDYDIARKMAADALELDEEDIDAETREFGAGAIVRRLIKEDAQDRVNDLEIEEYAVQLEKNLNVRKRHTLNHILEEFTGPFDELRGHFNEHLSEGELFTMLTGETRDSLQKGMTVPMLIKRVTDLSVEGRLDCGLEAHTMDGEAADGMSTPKQLYAPHQTIQAHILNIDRRSFTVGVSLREEMVKRPFRKFDRSDRQYDEWDERQEGSDRKILEQKTDATGRVTRVIKHPLFRSFNAKQAEEYLGSQNRGDVVVRPSSKGMDHLAVTWKVADGVFQHIDVLELDKENEFSLGRTLRVGGKYNYSDLDELIVMHVKAMSRKVDEMVSNEKFQDKSFAGIKEWLETYTNANPKRSMYQFCTNREKPGYFHLCFKAGQKANFQNWHVKIIPQGFELMKQPYPTMKDLCNGFKLLFSNMQNAQATMAGMARR